MSLLFCVAQEFRDVQIKRSDDCLVWSVCIWFLDTQDILSLHYQSIGDLSISIHQSGSREKHLSVLLPSDRFYVSGWMFQLLNVLCFVASSANHRVKLVLVPLLCAQNSNRPVTSLKQPGLSSQIMFQTLSWTPSCWRKKVGKGGERIGKFVTLGRNQLLLKPLLTCTLKSGN